MIYFYEHFGRFTRCEVRTLPDAHYELRVSDGGSAERVEEFDSYDALVRRLDGLDCEWRARGWTGPHGRDL